LADKGITWASFNEYRNKILALKHNRKMEVGMFNITSGYIESDFVKQNCRWWQEIKILKET